MKKLAYGFVLAFAAMSAAVAFADPGLYQKALSGAFNTTDDPSDGGIVVPGALLASTHTSSYTYEGTTYTMGDGQTYAYNGVMFMKGGVTYYFVKNYDDNGLVRITNLDGTEVSVINSSTYNQVAYGNFTPESDGYYGIDLRVGNGTGGKGPVAAPFNSSSQLAAGLAWNAAGLSTCTTSNYQQWRKFMNTEGDEFLFTEEPSYNIKVLKIPSQVSLFGEQPAPGFVVTNYMDDTSWTFGPGGTSAVETPLDVAYTYDGNQCTVTVTGKAGSALEGMSSSNSFAIYRRVKSITSTSSQYIDTGIVPGPNTAVEMYFNTTNSADNTAYFGAGAYNANNSYVFYPAGGFYYFRGAVTTTGLQNEQGVDGFVSISTNAADNLHFSLGGNAVTKTMALTYAGSNKLNIFASNNGGNKSRLTLYSFKIWQDGELVRDFVPVRGNAVGLWDFVTSTFFGNAGTGVFAAGPDETDIAVARIPNQFYSGTALEPSVVVSNLAGTALLVKDVDYTVAYEDNAVVGTGKAIVTGIGAYGSVVTNTFAIYSAPTAAMPASAYVQHGLMNHWDAIDNVGTGTFDPTAKTWKDLKGSLDFALNGNADWGEGFLETHGYSGAAPGKTGKYLTLEIKYRSDKARRGMPFFSGYAWNRVVWYFALNQLWFHHQNNANRAVLTGMTSPDANDRDIAVVYGAASGANDAPMLFYEGGIPRTNGISNQKYQTAELNWVTSFTRASIGGASETQCNYEGRIYSIRLYDCPLSEREIAYNAAVDKVRYEGVAPAEAFNAPDMRWNATSGKVEVLIDLSTLHGTGSFSINGGSASAWVAHGDEVSIVYTPVGDEKALEWFGLPDGAPRSADLFTVTFTAEAPVSATLQMFKKIDVTRALNADPGVEEGPGYLHDGSAWRTFMPVCWNRSTAQAGLGNYSTTSDERGWHYLSPYQGSTFFQEGLALPAGNYTLTFDHAANSTDHTIYSWQLVDTNNAVQSICNVTNEMRIYGTSWHTVQADFTVAEGGIYKLQTVRVATGAHGNCYSLFDNISITSDTDLHIEVEKCYPFFGEAQVRPPVVVRDDDGNVLTEGVDYELLYGANNSVGSAMDFSGATTGQKHGNGYVAAKGLGTHYGVAGANFRIGTPIYVKPDGLPSNGGTSWADAVDFATALTLAATPHANSEIWIAGSNVLTAAAVTQTFYGNKIFRGGFKGTESTIEEREDGAYSVIDGDGQFSAVVFTDAANVYFERLVFRGSPARAVSKTGWTGDFFVDDCVFEENGNALFVRGLDKTPYDEGALYVKNSVFRNNSSTDAADGAAAIYSYQTRRVSVENTLFYGNTLATSSKVKTSAIYANNSAVELKECDFIGNIGSGVTYGTVRASGSNAPNIIENCLFRGNQTDGANGAAVMIDHSTLEGRSEIANCTFTANANATANGCAGVKAVKGQIVLRNSIFAGNGVDFADSANSAFDIDYTLLADDTGATYSFVNSASKLGASMVYGDPLFAAADDCHLLSEAGYFDSDGVIHYAEAGVRSPAIDAGDPESDYSRESAPNGGCVNLGRYANTEQASRTPSASPAVGEPTVVWDDPDGYTMPTISFTMGGSGAYTAHGTIYISTDGGTTWVDVSGTLGGLVNGQIKTFLVPAYYVPGDIIQVKVAVEGAGQVSESATASSIVSGKLPPWTGKGGPANVIHVRPGAIGAGTGDNWSDAVPNLRSAFSLVNAAKNEIWIAGTNVLKAGSVTLAASSALTVRGGFHGWENSAAEREEGFRSIIDGDDMTDCLTINNSAAVSLERILFIRSLNCGLIKTGAGDMRVSDCYFLTNGMGRATNASGKGARVSGTKTTTVVTFANCVFRGNRCPTGVTSYGTTAKGAGINASSIKCLRLEDCYFVHNGIPRRSPGGGHSSEPSSGASFGSAVFSTAPVSAVGCRFAANFGNVRNTASQSAGNGGVVRLHMGAEGSAFTNCDWVANGDQVVWNGATTNSNNAAGALTVLFDSNSGTVDIQNCTFAYNLADGYEVTAGINLIRGTVNLRNSIFYGNIIGGFSSSRGADLSLRNDSVCNVSYTLFSEGGTNSITCAATATTNFLGGVIYGDPLFVTENATMTNLVKQSTATALGHKLIFWDWDSDAIYGKLEAANVHLRGGCGYFDESTGNLVRDYAAKKAASSPAIDAGDPNSDYKGEPGTRMGWHGRRVNLGGYGNTPWATLTPLPGAAFYLRF